MSTKKKNYKVPAPITCSIKPKVNFVWLDFLAKNELYESWASGSGTNFVWPDFLTKTSYMSHGPVVQGL